MLSKPSKDDDQSLFHIPKMIEVNSGAYWPIRIVFYLLSFWFVYDVYVSIIEEDFSSRGKYYTLEEDPTFFWIMMGLYSVAGLVMFWQGFRVKIKQKT